MLALGMMAVAMVSCSSNSDNNSSSPFDGNYTLSGSAFGTTIVNDVPVPVINEPLSNIAATVSTSSNNDMLVKAQVTIMKIPVTLSITVTNVSVVNPFDGTPYGFSDNCAMATGTITPQTISSPALSLALMAFGVTDPLTLQGDIADGAPAATFINDNGTKYMELNLITPTGSTLGLEIYLGNFPDDGSEE